MSLYAKAQQAMLVGVLVAGALVAPAGAQYVGPSAMPESSVAEILKNPVDDQDVVLQGHLLRQISSDKYVFSDGSAEIIAEIERKQFPAQPINEKTRVELIGEVDTGLTRAPEIEVDSLRIIE